MQRKSLWKLSAALALPMLTLAASTHAAVLFDSTGFEQPPYNPGELGSQQGWVKYGAGIAEAPGSAVVTVGAGNPAVVPTETGVVFQSTVISGDVNRTVDGAGNNVPANDPNASQRLFTTAYYQPVTFDSGAGVEKQVSVKFDLKSPVGGFTRTQSLAGVEVYDINGFLIAGGYYGSNPAGVSTVNGANNAGASTTQAQAPAGAYASYELVLDFLTSTYDVFVGGILELNDLAFANGATTSISEIDLTYYNGNGGAEAISLDNISVTSIPEPASLSLLGLAGIGLLARRRK